MVEAATNFRKSGFNDSDSAMLAQVAAQYQNIADTAVSAGDAAASIVSQIRAFGEDASFATTVINAYNEVANKFSVGTNDLSQAMEIASSGMATYGNSFQQVIGLVTGGTEIMQGRASQVARGLSTIAARIVKNQDALAEYGIQVEKTDGSLKSTFDVLSELKPKWDAMTDAQRVALGDTLAGQNQYKVLASVLQNFQHAIDATNTALESAGSAAEENARYMESLEAKENALKAEFEDFANRVLSKDVVKGFLEAGTSMLDFANNDVGAAISRIGLLATGMTGLTGIVGQTVGKIVEVGLQLKNLGVGGGSFLGMLASGKVAIIVGGVVLAVTALVEVIRALKSSYDAAHPSFEQANENLEKTQDEISQTTDKLKEYKDQLAKLDEVAIEDRGAAWQSERSELELNIEASQSYLDILERIRELQGQQAYEAGRPIGYTAAGSIAKNQFKDDTYYGAYQATGDRSVQLSAKQADILNAQYSDQYQALTAITLALADATDEQYRYIEAEDLAELQGKSQEEQIEIMTDMLGKLGIALDATYESSEQAFSNMGELANKTGELSQAQKDQAQAYIDSYDEIVKVGAATKEQGRNYVDLAAKLNNFNSSEASAADNISFVASLFDMSADAAARYAAEIGYLDSANIAVAGGMVQLADGAWALKENCYQAADGLYYLREGCDSLAGAGTTVSDAFSQIEIATYNADTATGRLTTSLFDANGKLTTTATTALQGSSAMAQMATAEIQAQQAAAQANFTNLINEINKVGSAAMLSAQQLSTMMSMAGINMGGSASNAQLSGLKRTYQQKFGKSAESDIESFNKWVSGTMLATSASNYDRQMKELEDKLTQIQNITGVGGGGGSSKKSAEEKAAEEAEKQAKKAQKAQEKAAKQSQQAYESAAKSAEQAAQEAARAAEQAAEEAKQKILDSIQELKDASDDFWDSKTDAIEETNKELDRQKQLEEKLKALEEAKQKKILLYKNGQFQYDKDYGTIAKAQADYEETRDKIQRERELEQLQEMKDNATEIFNEMKDIVQNGGDVTQEMINNWLSQMQADGADYYDSNKKLLGEWLDWAKNALQTYGQGVVDAVNGYVSTSSLMSNGTYGSNAQGQVANDTNGARYRDDPMYWKDGEFVGFTKAFWIDVFDAQIKKGQFGDYTKTDAWLGNLPGTSIFDDWEEVFKYWSSQEHADIYALQDMVDRFEAAKIVFSKYKDIFASLGYDEYAKMAEQYDNIDSSKYSRMAWQMSMVQHPDDPFGWRSYEPAWRGTRREDTAELWQTMNDILDMMWANNYQGNAYKTALGEAERASKRDWHINIMDESDRYEYATFDLDKLKAALDENEEAIKQLSEKYFEVATDLERQAIAVEAESRRKFRDLGYAQLGMDTTAQSEAERAANRQTSGKTLDEARRDKKLANNVDDINKTLEKVENGQAISQGYITKASDYISKMIAENSEKWFTLYDQTEKDKLHQQTEELRALQEKLQKANDLAEINNLLVHGEALLPNEKADFEDKDWKEDKKYEDWVREAEDLDDTAEDIRRQMELNAQRWFDADEKTKDELHRANEELAGRLAQETGTNLSYSGETGKWSKNATGTRNFRGGLSLVGERGPEMRILGQGDNIIPANQTANLWKWSNTTPQQMLTTLSARSGGGNTSYSFDVSRIELPNVTDAKSFVQGLKNYALQYSYKR